MSLAESPDLPILHLHPHPGEWAAKRIPLGDERIPVGRNCIPIATYPEVFNGYFESKILSRRHAEIWHENGKVYIRDTKSTNGTFINGRRLAPSGEESAPFELKNDDILELGIDIFDDDKKTVLFHKTSARVEYTA